MDPAGTSEVLTYDRLHFAGTIIFHYLFPQLTMGLAFLLALFSTRGYWWRDERYERAARFWGRILAITFAFGVATGVPMEFQFGTNWANFSRFAGGCIGQTLALEGTFAFFLESFFIGAMLAGAKRLGDRFVWVATLVVFAGAWLSAYFILATNAWMQHPVGYELTADGVVRLRSFWHLLGNPWLAWQYSHNQSAAVVTGSFVVAGAGAYYLLSNRHIEQGRLFLRTGLIVGAIASFLLLYPTGDGESLQVWRYQPTKGAAMEGLFFTEQPAAITIVGQPNMETLKIDNPIKFPGALSYLTYRRFDAEVIGLTAYPRAQWPDHVPLVYYAYHIMVGLGTIYIGVTFLAVFLLWRRKLYTSRWMLWIIMLITPFPYISTTAGWVTAEMGRQPWLTWGLLRTTEGASSVVHSGNVLFTMMGFAGLYLLMGIAYMVLSLGLFARGPEPAPVESPAVGPDGPESADRQPQRGPEARDTGEEGI
jgi:cytochrome d ubiquinol oxidase subunit I